MDWTLGGEATAGIGASTGVEVRTLGEGEVENATYYYPPHGSMGVDDCRSTERDDMVASASDSMLAAAAWRFPTGPRTITKGAPVRRWTIPASRAASRIRDLDLSNKLVPLDLPTHAPTFAPVPMPTVSSAPAFVPRRS